jgi:hypothetical protein
MRLDALRVEGLPSLFQGSAGCLRVLPESGHILLTCILRDGVDVLDEALFEFGGLAHAGQHLEEVLLGEHGAGKPNTIH